MYPSQGTERLQTFQAFTPSGGELSRRVWLGTSENKDFTRKRKSDIGFSRIPRSSVSLDFYHKVYYYSEYIVHLSHVGVDLNGVRIRLSYSIAYFPLVVSPTVEASNIGWK